jgi:DNA repair protein RadC
MEETTQAAKVRKKPVRDGNKQSIKDWNRSDRPREKLLEHKPRSLTESELLAILIRTGNTKKSALELGRALLDMHKNLQELGKCTARDLMKVEGIGAAKAATIAAAFELGRRRQSQQSLERHFIRNSKEGAEYIRPLIMDYGHEVFGVLYLVQAGWIRSFEIVHEGGITSTTVDLRIIFKKALEQEAVSIIVAHNHPSGSLRPSKADEVLTQKLCQASRIMDIKLLDHIILSDKGYFSFADEGLLN